eukprot:m.122463 g.122463  ORF g.122463 m.122463 type:complete len:108 (-) comp52122_c0_seq4:198-521(-)
MNESKPGISFGIALTASNSTGASSLSAAFLAAGSVGVDLSAACCCCFGALAFEPAALAFDKSKAEECGVAHHEQRKSRVDLTMTQLWLRRENLAKTPTCEHLQTQPQ